MEIVGIKETTKTTVTGVEMFHKLLDQGQAGDNIGTLLRGITTRPTKKVTNLPNQKTTNQHEYKTVLRH